MIARQLGNVCPTWAVLVLYPIKDHYRFPPPIFGLSFPGRRRATPGWSRNLSVEGEHLPNLGLPLTSRLELMEKNA